ncbi:MAG: DNA recombination protein RmuC [Bacteroidales bacterium]
MEIIYVLTGFIAGSIAAWGITNLALKSKTVSRSEFENLKDSWHETKNALEIAQEKNKQLADDLNTNLEKHEDKTRECNSLQTTLADYKAKISEANRTVEKYENEINILKHKLDQETENAKEAYKQTAELKANNDGLKEKLNNQKKEIEELSKKFNTEFENIANKILDEKSVKFTKQNKENLESILKPLGENIDNFKKKVEEVYDKESKERFSLGKEVEKLVSLNQQISQEAHNLTNALKGNSKTQGDWGQMILENILEKSGLVKDREYFVQEYLKNEDGNYQKNNQGKRMQPDVIIAYPDNRKVIIDSKVSLTAYTKYAESDDPQQQQQALQEHLKSIRRHIDDLSSKNYQDFAPTLDFVMMFVPNEPAYLVALQNDPDLWHYAYNKRILLISPTNLIAALKLIVDLWKREYQNQNAQAIADRGKALYDKFVNFVNNLNDLGKHIQKTQESYDEALGKLKYGKGNLIGQAEKLRNLGIKSQKNIPRHFINENPEYPVQDDETSTNESNMPEED